LYHPQTSLCHEAFKQGPCKSREILILKKTSSIPVCERNPCSGKQVQYNRICSDLPSTKACTQPKNDPTHFTLHVNPSSMQLECGKTSLYSRLGEELIDEENKTYATDACFVGGKRAQEGKCKIENPQ
jgi:hypothetical protein